MIDQSRRPSLPTLGENGRGIQRVLDTLPRGHFDALVGRGADPIWIPGEELDDGIHLFHFTHWLATEGEMLRSSQLALYL